MASKPRKPTPKMLGSGMAYRAAVGLKGRKSRLDAAIEEQSGGSRKPAPKKKSKK